MVVNCLMWIVFLGSLGFLHGTFVTNTTESLNKYGLSESIISFEPLDESPVKVTGAFTNVKDDGEHAYGYTVNVWKQEEKIYGFVSSIQGLSGDPPTGILEEVEFDSKTKKLSFMAKLSLGKVYDKNYNGVWSQDVFKFEGVLMSKKLVGELTIRNELYPEKPSERKKIYLRLSKDQSSAMSDFPNYSEWKAYADEILKFRGPKW